MRLIDLTGKKFGKLIVIRRSDKFRGKHRLWECRCDCGNIYFARSDSLRSLNVRSCGCGYRKHNMTDTLIYKVWQMMKDRCSNPKSQSYGRYGGRGISVCPEWKQSPIVFINWSFSNGYKKGLSIDRIDNDGNYEPSNCRFVSCKTNVRNSSWAKLCLKDVVRIKKLLFDGQLGNRDIGNIFGVSDAVIRQIKNNKNWKDVPWPCASINQNSKE